MQPTVFANGLKVLVEEVHIAPIASVWCWYRVGSKDESTGLTGVSHWVEHMNFKGTTNIPREQIKGIIEKFGGSWNGYTWIDQTTYMGASQPADAGTRASLLRFDGCGFLQLLGLIMGDHVVEDFG